MINKIDTVNTMNNSAEKDADVSPSDGDRDFDVKDTSDRTGDEIKCDNDITKDKDIDEKQTKEENEKKPEFKEKTLEELLNTVESPTFLQEYTVEPNLIKYIDNTKNVPSPDIVDKICEKMSQRFIVAEEGMYNNIYIL